MLTVMISVMLASLRWIFIYHFHLSFSSIDGKHMLYAWLFYIFYLTPILYLYLGFFYCCFALICRQHPHFRAQEFASSLPTHAPLFCWHFSLSLSLSSLLILCMSFFCFIHLEPTHWNFTAVFCLGALLHSATRNLYTPISLGSFVVVTHTSCFRLTRSSPHHIRTYRRLRPEPWSARSHRKYIRVAAQFSLWAVSARDRLDNQRSDATLMPRPH